ncbi:DNA polymerase III subunit chi [Aggregatibacter actinomycetemcomitans]|uniref:DNA polymerase III subunit chi n=1 Tax=Aggregatibacter actinomycetemcomitans TaxID=714 RepID=UPI0011D642F7|nr:DNA polymerase III subunit chi [Aggregatibacter actinomycetemcomitans]TYA23621.1 DNA polymerase III subunit chi [Aggregatibacter actinomycetemcomitans]
MPKNAQFYLLSDASPAQTNLSAVESLACNLAASAWRLGKRVLLACENEAQALNIDEALWQREPDEFVPHNLSGETTTYATPIEISWTGKRNAQSRDLLINLQPQLPEFINSFNQIIDFVPAEEQQKALARERYKQLRQLGWELSTEQAG